MHAELGMGHYGAGDTFPVGCAFDPAIVHAEVIPTSLSRSLTILEVGHDLERPLYR